MDTAGSDVTSAALEELLEIRAGGALESGEVVIEGADPFFRVPHRVGSATAAALAAVGVAANDLWEQRTGRRQRVGVSVAEAAASLKTVDYTMERGPSGEFEPIPRPDGQARTAALIKPWPTRDGRWFLPHFTLPHLREKVLGVLACEATPESVGGAIAKWDAEDLDQAIADAGACGGIVRSPAEWHRHPQGAYLSTLPVVEIERRGESAAEPLPDGDRPLSGIRVLDLTRILAGPMAGRTLAEHGADVLMVTAPDLPQIAEHVRDTSHGKRSSFLDLKTRSGVERLTELVRTADVVIDGYRPGRVGELGFDLQTLFDLRPGLVHLNITCYGNGGPFRERGGWDQVAQAVSGMCHENGRLSGAGRPALSFPPTCDYDTGYLGAYGVMLALGRRGREGGSYAVNVSLCQTALYVQRRGVVDGFADAPNVLSSAGADRRYVIEPDTSYGTLKTLGPVLDMSETAPHWSRPTPRLGGDEPKWMPREERR
ncbi:CoA transferase [Microbacterium rhizomatis]|uniref:CoA transferase n=2 Tax=Microbacterium rhizomatis TaxID=1631477 RepID=A0A5J5J1S4_9MICO|nr:CoA transferase [Microbacterium rhizomatis]